MTALPLTISGKACADEPKTLKKIPIVVIEPKNAARHIRADGEDKKDSNNKDIEKPNLDLQKGLPKLEVYPLPQARDPEDRVFRYTSGDPASREIEADHLKGQLGDMLRTLVPMFDAAEEQTGQYIVDQIELHLSVNSEGGVSLIGHATVGVTGGIKLLLKHKDIAAIRQAAE